MSRSGQPRTRQARRHFAAWLALLVLAVNLFGWHGTARLGGHSGMMAGMMMDGMCQQPMPAPARDGSGPPVHPSDDLHCPACFPLGSAAHGAMLAVPPQAGIPGDWLAEAVRPPRAVAPAGRTTTPHRARDPPAIV